MTSLGFTQENTPGEDVREFYREQGRQQERERIIKLLVAERWTLPNGLPAGGVVYLPIEEAIALIKGNK
jgi:hypothetical protein